MVSGSSAHALSNASSSLSHHANNATMRHHQHLLEAQHRFEERHHHNLTNGEEDMERISPLSAVLLLYGIMVGATARGLPGAAWP